MLDQNSHQADNGNQAEAEGNRNDQNQQRSLVDSIVQNVIRYRRLDKVLERPHLAGIAFSGTVGMGIF